MARRYQTTNQAIASVAEALKARRAQKQVDIDRYDQELKFYSTVDSVLDQLQAQRAGLEAEVKQVDTNLSALRRLQTLTNRFDELSPEKIARLNTQLGYLTRDYSRPAKPRLTPKLKRQLRRYRAAMKRFDGDAAKRIRKDEMDLTQEEVAAIYGIARSTVSGYEVNRIQGRWQYRAQDYVKDFRRESSN